MRSLYLVPLAFLAWAPFTLWAQSEDALCSYTPPDVVACVPPVFPSDPLKHGKKLPVMIDVLVDREGKIVSMAPAYSPGQIDGTPVSLWARQIIPFRLQ